MPCMLCWDLYGARSQSPNGGDPRRFLSGQNEIFGEKSGDCGPGQGYGVWIWEKKMLPFLSL
uniref:Uncharacterized protein n=1 Tax=mine drainage metagenome TaxID=410659 RepID=E6QCA7_9ZZZZ